MDLIRFYLGDQPDDAGRWLRDFWTYDYNRLEESHDFIQYMFPLADPSAFNRRAPTLDDTAIREFRASPVIRDNLVKSLEVMLDFYGFTLDRASTTVSPGLNFKARAENWQFPDDHNHLRITRILKCLMLCGLQDHARAVQQALVASVPANAVSPTTRRFWDEAVR